MCLGVPMQVIEIDGFLAQCEAKGIRRKVSLFLMQHENIVVGDMVLVHVGNAIQKMTRQEAQSAWELYDEILGDETPGPDTGVSGNA
jgi:hydrogenase expression/formation protein HypC